MYEILVKASFSSAHNIKNYKGKCEHLHGHNYVVEVYLESNELNDEGMVMDFSLVKKELKDILNTLDHKYLNEIDFFKTNNPSAENIAKYIYKNLKNKISILKKVCIWETEDSCACFMEK